MAKWANDAVMNAALNYIADNGDKMHVCTAQPTTYAEANATYSLGDVTLTLGAGNGDYTLADGDTNGRKLTVGAQTGITATGSGSATHIAITNGSDTLIYVTTCTSQSVTSGNTVNINAFDIEISDPS